MLARLAGNHALKEDLSAALGTGRLPHSILLVGEPGTESFYRNLGFEEQKNFTLWKL